MDFIHNPANGIITLKFLKRGYLPIEMLTKDINPPKTKLKVEVRLILDATISQGTAILQLPPSKEKPLFIWWDTQAPLDFSLNIFNCIRTLSIDKP